MSNTLSHTSTDGEQISSLDDPQLLLRFVANRDEAAFREIVARHGPLVMGVCVRVLSHLEDAEDGFQATFIVLSKRAKKIRKRESLSAWLYGVAFRVSVDIARKRKRVEPTLVSEPMQTDDPFEKLEHEFDRQVVDEEIQRLPEKFRAPLILFYLCGKTSKEIAADLGTSQGTIDGRIKRGRQQLRVQLTRRGVSLTGMLSVICVSAEHASAAVSPSLIDLTVSACASGWSGTPMPDTISQTTLRVAGKEALRMSILKPLTITASLALLVTVGTICAQAFDGSSNTFTSVGSLDTRTTIANDPVSISLASLSQSTDRQDNPFNAGEPTQPEGLSHSYVQAELKRIDDAEKKLTKTASQLEAKVRDLKGIADKLRDAGRFHRLSEVDKELFSVRTMERENKAAALLLKSERLRLTNKHAEAAELKNQASLISTELAATKSRMLPRDTFQGKLKALREKRESALRIENILGGKTEPITGGDSLKSVLDFMADVHGLRIMADRKALSDADISSLEDLTVQEDLQISDIQIGSALEIVLQRLDETTEPLDYIIRNEFLVITTAEVAEAALDTRVYELVMPSNEGQELLDAINIVLPKEESPTGANVSMIEKKVIARTNRRGHKALLDFFVQMKLQFATDKQSE
ncbi:MAG: RNA polymerase sigma factor [Planctomycetaceae bacterium]